MRIQILMIALNLLGSAALSAQTTNQVVTGTVLVNDQKPADFKTIAQAAKKDWKIRVDSMTQAEKTLVLHTSAATIMFANMDYPASPAEIKPAAEGAWMWPTARDEAPQHKSQVVISVIGLNDKPIYLYSLFTQAASAVLEHSNSCGVYMPSQYLLQSKSFYLQAARNLEQSVLPLYCWVYFGMFTDGGLSSAYTFGLTEFGMPDLEIVKSEHSLQEVHAVLYDAAKDALQNRKKLGDGSVIETLEGEKITLKLGKSAYLDGEMLQVEY